MHGNLWEWCNDWYGGDYTGDETDPTGPDTGDDRLLRGGCWGSAASRCRSACRHMYYPEAFGKEFGFRPVRTAGISRKETVRGN